VKQVVIPHLVTEFPISNCRERRNEEREKVTADLAQIRLAAKPRLGTLDKQSCKGDKKYDFSLSNSGTG
jgi:hypothetical protein